MSFQTLGLSQPVLQALAFKGYSEATPIQTQAIPTVLKGRDLLGIAQTGTGKTAAFMLPSIDRLAAGQRRASQRACRMLVLAPTRELAGQIADSRPLLRPVRRHARRHRVRRHLARQEPAGRGARRRRPRRHPRPPDRPGRAGRADPARGRDPRPRRGRPDARPRLHPCAEADREDAAREAPDPVLLGDHAEGDQGAGRQVPDRSGPGLGRPVRRPRPSGSINMSPSSSRRRSRRCSP